MTLEPQPPQHQAPHSPPAPPTTPNAPSELGTHSPAPGRPPSPDEADMLPLQISIDRLLANAILIMGFGTLLILTLSGSGFSSLAMFVFMMVILATSLPNTRAVKQFPLIQTALLSAPDTAETLVRSTISKRLLHPSTRLTLYAYLAQIRLRQRHYANTAAISTHVLTQLPLHRPTLLSKIFGRPDLIANPHVRHQLLLIMVEARLQCGDPWGAYFGLVDLHASPLNLPESMHLLLLQTRYEVLLGFWAQSLDRLTRKISLAELLPTPQCGQLHAFWAAAAHQTSHPWSLPLRQRAELLCEPAYLVGLDRFVQACGVNLTPQTNPRSHALDSPG